MRDTDRRVRFTKMTLRESLIKLLEEKNIAEISVTELCRCADVNRGTFYAHYRQPSDVLVDIEENLISELSEIMRRDNTMENIHYEILNCLHNNRKVCRMLLGPNSSQAFMQRVTEMSIEKFSVMWSASLDLSAKNLDHLHRFMFAGTSEIIRYWLMNDENLSPSEIATTITDIQRRILQIMKLDPLH